MSKRAIFDDAMIKSKYIRLALPPSDAQIAFLCANGFVTERLAMYDEKSKVPALLWIYAPGGQHALDIPFNVLAKVRHFGHIEPSPKAGIVKPKADSAEVPPTGKVVTSELVSRRTKRASKQVPKLEGLAAIAGDSLENSQTVLPPFSKLPDLIMSGWYVLDSVRVNREDSITFLRHINQHGYAIWIGTRSSSEPGRIIECAASCDIELATALRRFARSNYPESAERYALEIKVAVAVRAAVSKAVVLRDAAREDLAHLEQKKYQLKFTRQNYKDDT